LKDTPNPLDKGRRFVMSYRLSDDMMTIYEPPIKNSGVVGGKFLEKTRVAKPGSTPERPQFYGPQDFAIGAVIHVFRHRFLITNADAFVLSYMEQHPQQFSCECTTVRLHHIYTCLQCFDAAGWAAGIASGL